MITPNPRRTEECTPLQPRSALLPDNPSGHSRLACSPKHARLPQQVADRQELMGDSPGARARPILAGWDEGVGPGLSGRALLYGNLGE
jgi:hypothetical protein